jgi:hypothetical protein
MNIAPDPKDNANPVNMIHQIGIVYRMVRGDINGMGQHKIIQFQTDFPEYPLIKIITL